MKKRNNILLILIGAPGSGKTTFAKYKVRTELNWFRVSRDDLRSMQFSGGNMTPKDEYHLTQFVNAQILHLLNNKTNVILDATNTKVDYLTAFISNFQSIADIEFKIFDEEIEILKKRCADRFESGGRFIPNKIIERHHKNVQKLLADFDLSTRLKNEPDELIYSNQNQNLPKAIVCDLDGTLAIMNGRDPYDAAKCSEDLLNEPIAEILRTYHDKGDKILLLSGRTDQFKPETEKWLSQYSIPYDNLWMRKAGDSRKDSIIKKELVDANILDQYFVRFVLDDRDQVVEMWRKELNLPCLQVNYGNF